MAARALAAQGAEAFERREFTQALELFQRASAIIQAPTIMLMEARTLVELGRLVEAADRYGATQRMVSVDPANEAFQQAAADAQRELEPLLQRIPTMRVRVAGLGPGETVEIQIDGRKILPQLASVDRPFDPGRHRVDVKGSLGGNATREIALVERAHEDVELTLVPPPPVVAKAPPPPPPEPSGGGSARVLGWVITGTGAAFLTVGAISGVAALNHKADLDAVCKPGCPPSTAADIRAFRTERTLSYVGFGLGALGVGAGTVLLLTSPSQSVALGVSPSRISIAGTFR